MKPVSLIVVPAAFSVSLLLAACDSSNVQVVDDESNAEEVSSDMLAADPANTPVEDDTTGTPAEEPTTTLPVEIMETPPEETPDTPIEDITDTPAEENTDTPTEDDSDTPAEDDPDSPTEDNTDAPTEDNTDTPTAGDPDMPAQTEKLVANGTFEDGLADWEQVEPALESEDAFEGLGAAKLEDFGSITQQIVIQPNTRYVVSAFIEGTATIGIVLGDDTITASGTDEDYALVSFEFDSLDANTGELFARADFETTRLDNFEITSDGDTTTAEPDPEPESGDNLVENGNFENGLDDWDQVEPAFESQETLEGLGSAKIEDEGSISQSLSVDPQSRYRVSAFVQGDATIGVLVEDDRISASGSSNNFELVSFEFDIGDVDSVTLFAETTDGTGTVRIDNFEVTKIDNVDPNEATVLSVPADAVNLVFNARFENSLSGWKQIEPAQSSEDSYEGLGSAKLFSLGSISQSIFVTPESRYRVSAFLQGSSTMGIEVGDEIVTAEAPALGDTYQQVTLEFESGGASTAEFFVLAPSSEDVTRADNIEVVRISGGDGSIPVDPNDVFDFTTWEVEGESPITRDGEFSFDALDQCVVTPNSNGCRHEMKVLESERFGLTEQYEYFKATIQPDLSSGADTIVVQHHPGGTGTLAALYLSDRSNPYGFQDVENGIAYDGVFDVFVTVRTPGTLENQAVILGTVQSGESFDYEVINDHGSMTITAFDKSVKIQPADSAISYLKFGNYLQAIDPDSGERINLERPLGPEDRANFLGYYADFGIDRAVVVFRDVQYSRTVD